MENSLADIDKAFTKRKQRNRFLGWIALGILLLGLVILAILCGWWRTQYMAVTVYYPGNPDINDNAAVLFRKEAVGKIDSILAGLPCVQFIVHRYNDEYWQETATIELDSMLTVGDLTTGQYIVHYTQDIVTIRPANSTATVHPMVAITYAPATMTWSIAVDSIKTAEPRHLSDVIMLNEKPIGKNPVVLLNSSEIGLGNGLRIRWNEPAIHTRVFMCLDTARIRKLANIRTSPLPLTAALANLSTGFALARPGIRLTMPPLTTSHSLVDYSIPEMMQQEDFDLYAVLNQVGGYLTDKRKIFAPPHNRVERAVNSANNGLQHLDSIITHAERISSNASYYLSSPAAIRRGPETRLDSLIADLNAIRGIAAAARDDIATLGGTAGRAIDNIDRTTVPRVNTAIDSLNAKLRQIDTLATRFDQLAITLKDTTLYRVEGSVGSIANDINVIREEVRRLVRSINTLVIQLR